jgi:hypothetical protein
VSPTFIVDGNTWTSVKVVTGSGAAAVSVPINNANTANKPIIEIILLDMIFLLYE